MKKLLLIAVVGVFAFAAGRYAFAGGPGFSPAQSPVQAPSKSAEYTGPSAPQAFVPGYAQSGGGYRGYSYQPGTATGYGAQSYNPAYSNAGYNNAFYNNGGFSNGSQFNGRQQKAYENAAIKALGRY